MKKISNDIANKLVETMERRQILLFDINYFLSALFLNTGYNISMTNNKILKAKTHLINLWVLMENNNINNLSTSMSQQFSSPIEKALTKMMNLK